LFYVPYTDLFICFFSLTFSSFSLPVFFYLYGAHRDLHSFPTRRSSDLIVDSDDEVSRLDTGDSGRGIRRDVVDQNVAAFIQGDRSEEHTSELQSRFDLVCRLLLEKKKKKKNTKANYTNNTHDNIA